MSTPSPVQGMNRYATHRRVQPTCARPPRKRTGIALLLAAAAFSPCAAHAATAFPARPVRLIVPFAPGAAQDLIGRMIAQKLTEAWPQQVVVDNRAGAGSTVGAEIAARAPADGYTLIMANESLAINATLHTKLAFDPVKDFAPITMVVTNPRVLIVTTSLPVDSVKELIAYARAKPGEIRYGSSGIGTGPHLTGALLASMAKVKMTHVPYKGVAPALVDTIAGQIQMVPSTVASALPHIQSGKVKALAVTTPKRSSVLPNVPTVAESGIPGFEATGWSILLAPAATPRAIVASIHADMGRILASDDVRKRLAADGGEAFSSTPEQAGEFLRTEIKRWAAVVKESGARPD